MRRTPDNEIITIDNYKSKLDTPEKKHKFFNFLAYDVQQNARMPFEYFIVQPLTLFIIIAISLFFVLTGENKTITDNLLNSLPIIVVIVAVMFKFNTKRKKDAL